MIQIVEMSDKEKMKMYMKVPKKKLVEMLIQCNKHLDAQIKAENDPYSYWPQCDVKGCKGVSCNGGGCWKDTGYWSVCPKHSREYRDGKPQPKMKQLAIKREKTRDKNGYLL